MTPMTVACLTFAAVAAGVLAVLATLLRHPDDETIVLPDTTLAAMRSVVGRVQKEDAACCALFALPDGRPVIGFCGPSCERRPAD